MLNPHHNKKLTLIDSLHSDKSLIYGKQADHIRINFDSFYFANLCVIAMINFLGQNWSKEEWCK